MSVWDELSDMMPIATWSDADLSVYRAAIARGRALEAVAEAARKEIAFCEPCNGRAPDWVDAHGACRIFPHAEYRRQLEALDKGDT